MNPQSIGLPKSFFIQVLLLCDIVLYKYKRKVLCLRKKESPLSWTWFSWLEFEKLPQILILILTWKAI